MNSSENTKLIRNPSEPKNFYFLAKTKSQEGAALGAKSTTSPVEIVSRPEVNGQTSNNPLGWLSSLFRRSNHAYQPIDNHKVRKVPVKIEPKVFFANERTFLAWLNMSVTLASISVAIVAFADANAWSQLYGLLMMPVAIAFCGYSLWMYMKRAGMIRRKDPGPYEDRFGPIVLACMLAVAILVNFGVKLYDYST